jgi:hypothetical protein
VLWRIKLDPQERCHHVNLVRDKDTHVEGECEFLFVPYSVFTLSPSVGRPPRRTPPRPTVLHWPLRSTTLRTPRTYPPPLGADPSRNPSYKDQKNGTASKRHVWNVERRVLPPSLWLPTGPSCQLPLPHRMSAAEGPPPKNRRRPPHPYIHKTPDPTSHPPTYLFARVLFLAFVSSWAFLGKGEGSPSK